MAAFTNVLVRNTKRTTFLLRYLTYPRINESMSIMFFGQN